MRESPLVEPDRPWIAKPATNPLKRVHDICAGVKTANINRRLSAPRKASELAANHVLQHLLVQKKVSHDSFEPTVLQLSKPGATYSGVATKLGITADAVKDVADLGGRELSDGNRGVQYAFGDDRKLLKIHGINASMSCKSNCLDKATMETFFSSLKRARTSNPARHTA